MSMSDPLLPLPDPEEPREDAEEELDDIEDAPAPDVLQGGGAPDPDATEDDSPDLPRPVAGDGMTEDQLRDDLGES